MNVSFILPVRNEKEYIADVLHSILHQKALNDYEIIFSDGSSDDGTLELINVFLSDFPNLKLIHNPNKIVSSGFNLALNEAKGDIIIRVDGHCELPPNYVEKCIALLHKQDADIVGGIIETISNGNIGKAIATAQSSCFGVGGAKFRNSTNKKSAYVNTLAFGAHKRGIFADIGGYDEQMDGPNNQDKILF